MENPGNAAEVIPSLTLITMFEYMPTLAAAGVPESIPVLLLKVSHDGRLEMLNVSLSPSGSEAAGVKL